MNRFTIITILFFTVITHSQTKQRMKLTQPPYLKKGDTVMVVAPAGTLQSKKAFIEKGIKEMESWGLIVVKGKYLFEKAHHFSATDEHRKEDLQQALDAPNIKAIWCARGGYGTTRIIDELDFTKFKKHPKWLIGYSDITALHSHINNIGIETIHGLMPIDFRNDFKDIEPSVNSLKKVLFGEKMSYEIPSSRYNQKGIAKGQLIGGNLTLLQNTIGSKSQLNTKGKIIFIEEIGEYKYHIDRMLISLKRAGFFENCNGVVVGQMTGIKKNTPAFRQKIETIILNAVGRKDIPILFDFPAGHSEINKALLLGRNVKLEVKKSSVSTLIFD
ncbi:MAG: LD-carboxypeptidase [Flavobacteriaceae bacterium]|nr:LD-carboxypeptidase [Flavobacteriaceae bacterium]